MRSTLKEIFAIYSIDSFLDSAAKRMLDLQIIIWHFLHIVENALRQIKEMELFDGIANKCEKFGEIRTKFEKEWEELTEKWQINEDFKLNVKICLLHGFTHRIIRHETLNGHSEWATYAKSVSNGIFSIEGGPEFDSNNISTFSEEDYKEHAKKCEESDKYPRIITNNLLSPTLKKKIYRMCLVNLITFSEEFQHLLCYHKEIGKIKRMLHNLLGRNELLGLEQSFPFILHIEIMPFQVLIDIRCVQFQYHTNSASAIKFENQIIFRHLLGNSKLTEREKAIRQSAEKGSELARHILSKVKAVKMEAMGSDAMELAKGICIVSKLAEFVEQQSKVAATEPKKKVYVLKRIGEWWPSECAQAEKAESVAKLARHSLQRESRQNFQCFMTLWRQMADVRGAPTRLHKFMQMTEREIELEIVEDKDDRYTDPEVFRNVEHLQMHYMDVFTTADPSHRKSAKLAADIFCWVFWLENEILSGHEKGKIMPRFTMAWEQNRWYYEMMYDQLFDLEEEAELAKKECQIGILLQMSKDLVEQKLKMPDEKLKIEFRSKKLERLQQNRQDGTAPTPPNGTVDRKWHEIRRKSEEGNVDEKQRSAIEEWLKQRHFDTIKGFLCNSKKFNREFEQRASDNIMRIGTIVDGIENVREIYDLAEKCKEKFANLEENAKSQNENLNEKNKENYSDKKETKNGKKLEKDEEEADQTEPYDVNEALKYVNSEKENNEGKDKKKKKGKKKPKPNKMPSEIGTKSEEENKNSNKMPSEIGTKSEEENQKPNKMPSKISTKSEEENQKPNKMPSKISTKSEEENQKPNKMPSEIGTKSEEENKNSNKMPSEIGTKSEEENQKPNKMPSEIGTKSEEENALREMKEQISEKESLAEILLPQLMPKNDGTIFETEPKENEKDNAKEGETMRGKEKKEKIIQKKGKTKNNRSEEKKNKQQNNQIINEQNEKSTENGSGEKMEEKNGILKKENDRHLAISMAKQNEFESIGLLDDEKKWLLFLKDEFLIKTYQTFFSNPSESMRQIVAIGSQINEIGHRMEIIAKLYPTGDQKLLNSFKELQIAPSKWIHKKLEQNWQLIRNDLVANSPIQNDQTVLNCPAQKIDQALKTFPSKSDQKMAIDSPAQMIDQSEICPLTNCDLDNFGLKTLQKLLWKHMKMVLKFFDANGEIEEKSTENEEKEMEYIGQQIKLRKMALALLLDKNNHFDLTQKCHAKTGEESEEKKALFGTDFDLDSFCTFFNHFSLMELRHFDGQNSKLIGNDSDESLESLVSFISKNGFGLINDELKTKIDQAIQEIEQIVKKWNRKAKFIVMGSYQLGALTKHSDIDAICVVPELRSWRATKFFGKAKCQIQSNGGRNCADDSLFCHFCLTAQVTGLNRIQDAWVPLIKFKFEIDANTSVDFDIGLETFAIHEEIFKTLEPINYEQSDALSAKMANKIGQLANRRREFINSGGGYEELMEMNSQREKLKRKLRSLAGFEVGIIILKKLFATKKKEKEDNNQNILRKYRTLLLAVKMWAKEHHIYDNKLGFFNGISLSLLVAKVMLLYPMASLPFLIEKFFFTFSTWPWPTPVKLSDLPDGSALRWDPSEEKQKRSEIGYGIAAELAMPILTPGHIEQNATFNVNRSTATIIRREMQNAIKIVRNWPNLSISLNEKWKSLIKATKFKEKFSHFIRINCKAFALADFYDFCGYVETRIRLQLLIDVERFDRIRLAHAKQIVEKGQILGENLDGHSANKKNPRKSVFFKVWLVGLELDEQIASENESKSTNNWKNWKEALNLMLSEQFNAVILRAYRTKNGFGGPLLHIQLTAQYEQKH
ncbi:hypothetical protein niasHT_000353 [Heterodera trifolii]|uniref:polynucleotide adenylyltransferase n=1 Tax=Heterodera trifolii TaxID=157864 RepID=A0ABD2MC71_9BILA